jgi:hypothetical protein
MPYEVKVKADYHELVSWLEKNIGPLEHEGDIFYPFWKKVFKEQMHPFQCSGKGWKINALGANIPFTYIVKVDDLQMANLLILRWV